MEWNSLTVMIAIIAAERGVERQGLLPIVNGRVMLLEPGHSQYNMMDSRGNI